MTDKTPLSDRMKGYEGREVGRRFLPLLPICVRIDGKRFSRWTDGLERPYDERLSKAMVATTVRLVEATSAVVGYTQSDEISLILYSPDPKRQVFLDGRIQKLVSILASMTTAFFNEECSTGIPERAERPAVFDARCWTVPTPEEATNNLLWRERDAAKNSLSMAARAHYPHDELMNRNAPELHELLHAVGVNWNDFPAFFKRGTFVQRQVVRRPFSADEVEALPARHHARQDPELLVERTVVVPVEMPPFGRVRNRVEVIFEGAAPIVGD